MTVPEINALSREEFVARLGWLFENSPWVAERVWEGRPFASLQDLHGAAIAAVQGASRDEQLALLRAHPDLGTRARVSAASAGEQKGAGLDALSPEEFDGLADLNRRYREKFGFPFLYAVKGSTKDDILLALTVRLDSDYEEELHQALWEVGRIAWFRLQDMFHAPILRRTQA
jgi:2-oxo-4-hydroxy-4-carboxy-5-ureidoimidazoline decarboxylase